MQRFLAVLCAVALTLSLHYIPARAQSGPAGINPSNFISAGSSVADTSGTTLTMGDSTHFTYVCGFVVSGLGATAATGVGVTVGPFTTTAGSPVSMPFAYGFASGATVVSVPLVVNFSPCLPASGVVTLTVPGAAGNTSTLLSMWGYKQ